MNIMNKEIRLDQTVNGVKIELVNRAVVHNKTQESLSNSWYVKTESDTQWTGAFKSSESAIKFMTQKIV